MLGDVVTDVALKKLINERNAKEFKVYMNETIEIKTIIKGKEAKNPVSIDRKLIAMIRPHIDF